MKAYLIIGYSGHGWNLILNCYFSLRKFDKTSIVIIINDVNEPLHEQLTKEQNLRYKTNETTSFELGCIKNAVYSYPDIDQFFIIHDSCEFIDTIPEFINDTFLFERSIADIAPALDEVKDWCEKYLPGVIYNDTNNTMCEGLMGIFSRKLLLEIFEFGLKYVNIQYKHEAVSSEGIFGILLKKFNNNIKVFHKYPREEYTQRRQSWVFIKKTVPGRGLCVQFDKINNNIYKGDIHHPETKRNFVYNNVTYDSLLSCIVLNFDDIEEVVFKYYHKNYDALLLLLNKRATNYQVENDYYGISLLLKKLHHCFYILKHFKEVRDNDNLQLEDIRNGNYLKNVTKQY